MRREISRKIKGDFNAFTLSFLIIIMICCTLIEDHCHCRRQGAPPISNGCSLQEQQKLFMTTNTGNNTQWIKKKYQV